MSPGLADLNRPSDMRNPLSPFQGFLVAVGTALIIVGLFMGMKIFFGILDVVRDPSLAAEMVDGMEEVIGWEDHEPVTVPVEIAKVEGEEGAPTISVTVPMKWNIHRIAAAGILVMLVIGLASIAMSIFGGGTRILSALLTRFEINRLTSELEKRRKTSDSYVYDEYRQESSGD